MLTDTVCVALSAGGLAIALLTAYRKRYLAATRIAAYALIPVGLAMTGILDWLTDLVFDPGVWLGFAVLGLSWLLFTVSRAVERRRAGAPDGAGELPPAGRAGRRPGLARRGPAANAPGTSRSGRRGSAGRSGSGDDDFSDIEAILKKHGI
ncbi:hypothetical protein IHE55_25325 [Streptomyces pactum]|uniref:DUF2304 domain-containing protein n=1 Tax=Streptomyces pactum TaxID=68249 RepID=A0ABS0NRT6_9ACTN|nr:hypothetical protein [Streptomyces pactum]MBH5337920.1 hypothetical protein [Streptomyces pactum]